MKTLTDGLFHLVCRAGKRPADGHTPDSFNVGFDRARTFFQRLGGRVTFTDKTVLDVGCGYGSCCLYLARNGAAGVVGIDLDEQRIDYARRKLAQDYPELSPKVEFRYLKDFQDGRFDLVVSQSSFEHYAEPERMLELMKRNVAGGGIIAIGFGSLWKSPYGGHISFMTRFPWAHLIFPESLILQERQKYSPGDEAATFAGIQGGLNKMTLARYKEIVRKSGLRIDLFKTNVTQRRAGLILKLPAAIPFLREYFTFNIYSVLSRPKSMSKSGSAQEA